MRDSAFQRLEEGRPGAAANIGKLLLEAGKLTPLQAEKIMSFQKERGIRFGQAAVELGFVQPKDIAEMLALQFDYPYLRKGQSKLSERLVAAYDPFSPAVEALRSLRTQLMLRWFSAGNKFVMFACHEPSSGSSLTIANLAIVFSQLGERTLIIDANLRTPRQHTLFGMGNDSGLTDILVQRADLSAIQKVQSLIGLYVLTAGTLAPNPQELLGRGQLAAVFDEVQHQFDIVLIDTAPLSESSDAQLLGPFAKGVIMVLQKNVTSARGAEKLNMAMKVTGAERLGVILTT
jgi:chain length determinant protein tyrosine kinase EpsG